MTLLCFDKEKVAAESRRLEYLTAAGGRQTFSADHLHLCSRQPEMMKVIEVDCEKWTTFDSPYCAHMDTANKEKMKRKHWSSSPVERYLGILLRLDCFLIFPSC